MINPKIPNKRNPPIIPIKIRPECMFVLLEIIIGRIRLSTVEEITPNIITPNAETLLAATKKYIATGTQTTGVPKIGKTPIITASNVKSNALGTLNMKKPIPAIIP